MAQGKIVLIKVKLQCLRNISLLVTLCYVTHYVRFAKQNDLHYIVSLEKEGLKCIINAANVETT